MKKINFNIKCQSCGKNYSMQLNETDGKVTLHCPFCSAPYEVDVSAAAKKVAAVHGPTAIATSIRRLEAMSSIAWLIIGIIQIVLIYTAAAGIWNIITAIMCLRNCKNIVEGNPNVVPYFESRQTWIIIAAVINLVLGGVIGVVLALLEMWLRSYVLKNRSVFENVAA
ncbi:MAG: hypothetical protein LUH47_10265 [Clostridiales bacterium]|nr:hypothetical protein [Clostridiales bacterium]